MKTRIVILASAWIMLMGNGAFAQQTGASASSQSTTVKKEEVIGGDNLKDTDQEITNAKLRAELGSKKKWSFRSTFQYLGSNVERPLSSDRPRITGSKQVSIDTSFSGLLGIKYRMADRDSLSLRTGLTILRPFGGGDLSGNSKLADVYLTWDRSYKVGEFQMISATTIEAASAQHKVEQKMLSSLNYGQTVMYKFANGIELGGILDLNYYIYGSGLEQNADTVTKGYVSTAGGDLRESYEIGLYPMLEYAFSDRYSFRTVFRYTTFKSLRSAPETFVRSPGTQSIGVGIALTRDVYLYPNFQFAPENLRPAQTNWGISTNINL